jgi:hypothetical protein
MNMGMPTRRIAVVIGTTKMRMEIEKHLQERTEERNDLLRRLGADTGGAEDMINDQLGESGLLMYSTTIYIESELWFAGS